MGRGLSGTGPETGLLRRYPGCAERQHRHPADHCRLFAADVPAGAVRRAHRRLAPRYEQAADTGQGLELPDPAQHSALVHPGPGGAGVHLAVLRFAWRGRHRNPDPDLRHARPGPEHRGRPGWPARPGLRGFLCSRRLRLCPALALFRPELLGVPATGRSAGGNLRFPPGLPGAAPAW